MSPGEIWLVIVLGGVFTFLMRLSFIGLVPPDRLPELARRGLDLVPPAVLAALVLPAFLQPTGSLDISFGNERLFAGLVAAVVAWRGRSIWLTIGSGMGVLWLLSGLG